MIKLFCFTIINSVNKGKQTQKDWLLSDEWLNRRMNATGETKREALSARRDMLNRLETTSIKVKDIGGSNSKYKGFAYNTDDQSHVVLGYDNPNDFDATANHEFIHASNSYFPNYTMKGIQFPTINNPDNIMTLITKKVIDYDMEHGYYSQIFSDNLFSVFSMYNYLLFIKF